MRKIWALIILFGIYSTEAVADTASIVRKALRDSLAASTPALQDKDRKFYGRDSQGDKNFCYVRSFVDLLTDKEYPSLTCWGSLGVSFDISGSLYNTGLTFYLRTGTQLFSYDPGEAVPITLRFYPGPALTYQGEASGGGAKVTDLEFINSILVQLSNEGKFVAVVGTSSGVIDDLTGAAQAVQDFRQRLSTGQQVLEVHP